MEIITASDIMIDAKGRWPMGSCNIGDRRYMLPSVDDLHEELLATDLEKWKWSPAADCDKFGAICRAWFAQKTFIEKLQFAWPVAEVRGHFQGIKERHELVAVWCKEGLRLVEPQTDEVRLPGPDDRIGAIWM
jgi:hypothetical protein